MIFLLVSICSRDTADRDDVAGISVCINNECCHEFLDFRRGGSDAALNPLDGILERENINIISVRDAQLPVRYYRIPQTRVRKHRKGSMHKAL